MNSSIYRIITWQPVLTDHQAHTFKELARLSGLQVIAKVATFEDKTRRAQGWVDTRVIDIERECIPSRRFIFQSFRQLLKYRHEIHIFCSAFGMFKMTILLWMATILRVKVYLVSEPYSPVPLGYFGTGSPSIERLKSALRPILYWVYVRAIRKGIHGIFTISQLAAQQYERSGMKVNKLFPFGYFVPSEITQESRTVRRDAPKDALRIAYVGSLIPRKDLPTLIAAASLSIRRGCNIQLDVYGPGEPSGFGFDGVRIKYAGRIPFGQSQCHLLGYDLLVLPSQYDGWGVVVNEALCAGVPVLCSDRVGARVLVETFGAGQVFPSGDVQALADQLVELVSDPAKLQEMKKACAAAAEAIQPSRAAAYMLEVLSAEPHARAAIPSPWYRGA